jgi:hypothetical protein
MEAAGVVGMPGVGVGVLEEGVTLELEGKAWTVTRVTSRLLDMSMGGMGERMPLPSAVVLLEDGEGNRRMLSATLPAVTVLWDVRPESAEERAAKAGIHLAGADALSQMPPAKGEH